MVLHYADIAARQAIFHFVAVVGAQILRGMVHA
jgi:hypothetical protein